MSQLLATIIGAVMPPIIEFVITKIGAEKRWLKYIIAFITCVIAGGATTILVDGVDLFDAENALGDIGLVFLASQTIYNTYWVNSGFQKAIIKKFS
jgi:hypothetical protein